MLDIAAININLPVFDYISFTEDRTFKYFDIILFNPGIPYLDRIYFSSGGSCISIEGARRLIDAQSHWREEIQEALRAGKTVFILASKPEKDLIAVSSESKRKGERTYNTNEISSYRSIPFNLNPRPATGKIIKFKGDLFKNFVNAFKEILEYKSTFAVDFQKGSEICAKDGTAIGGLLKPKGLSGSIVVLPYFEFGEDFVENDENGEAVWSSAAIKLARALQGQLVAIDKAVRAIDAGTPPPDWIQTQEVPSRVACLRDDAVALRDLIDKKRSDLGEIETEIAEILNIQNLLYGSGVHLETAIQKSLSLMGFNVETYRSGDVEIDHVILSPDGLRMIGEAEGKDNSAIDIRKFRQLESNIGEDFERDEVEAPAMGVLFGNGYRLIPPAERPDQFTTKSYTNAKRLGVALVRTSDLYPVTVHLIDNPDDEPFKAACRASIVNAKGKLAVFPKVP